MSMKYYDYDKAKLLVEEKKDSLQSAALGMHEDWFWTAQHVWEDGRWKMELMDNQAAQKMDEEYIQARKDGMSMFDDKIEEFQNAFIGGIRGSNWATPTIQLTYLDGAEEMIECSIGEQDISLGDKLEKQIAWTSGCLSEPVQANIRPLKRN